MAATQRKSRKGGKSAGSARSTAGRSRGTGAALPQARRGGAMQKAATRTGTRAKSAKGMKTRGKTGGRVKVRHASKRG